MENNVYNTRTLVRWLRWLGLSCLLLAGMINVSSAQVNTNSGSGLAPTYPSLAAAVTALNAATITSPVTITLTASETAPAGGFSITAQGSATNTIVIDGAGFTLTAFTPQTAGALNDAIIKLVGADFVTIQNFIMQENAANTTTAAATNNMTEWGVALLYATTTNGASSNTIQGNTISLNRTYQNTFGIYSNSTHSPTAISTAATATGVTGANDSLRIYTNNISNVNNGITYVGPTAAADQADYIDIGGSSAGTGNTLSNYGNTGTFSGYLNVSGTVNGILVRNVRNVNISRNSITSSNTAGLLTSSGTLRGIYMPAYSAAPTGTNAVTINNNSISVTTGVATGTLQGIVVEGTTGNATTNLTINANDFANCGYNVASPSGTTTLISSAIADLNTTINNNTFTNLNITSTGSVTFISNSVTIPAGGSQTIQANSIVTGFNKGGAGGTVTFFTSGSATVSATVTILHRNNNFSNVTVTGATGITGWNNTDGLGTSLNNKTFQNNTFSNITGGTSAITIMNLNYGGTAGGSGNIVNGNTITNVTGQGAVTGITYAGSTTNGVTSIYSNTLTNLTSTGTGGTVVGIACSSPNANIYSNTIGTLASSGAASVVTGISSSAATSAAIYKNKVYDLSTSAAGGSVSGITLSAGTNANIYNNIVGDLRASAANAANPVIGLNITGGTTVGVFYNSVYLNASSSGALFGSSAISASTTPTLTLRNNLFHNNSTANGAGLAVAYRRSTTTLTTYAAASNNNNFVASTIYYDGTTAYNWSGYQTLVSTRDNASINWTPVYLSTTGSNINFIHVDPSVATLMESGAVNITTPITITDDHDVTTRQGNGGYVGTGTAPDIGADEFEGTRPSLCSGAPTAGTASLSPAFRCGSGTTLLTVNDPNLTLGVTITWYESTTSGTWAPLGTQVPGGNGTSVTTPAYTSDRYFVASFKCSYTGDSVLSNEVHLIVYPAAVVTVSPTTATYCAGAPALALTASGGLTYAWSPATGLNATTGTTVNANPSANTVYTVTGTDANTCTATATASITYSLNLTSLTATATPSTICNGSNSALLATATTPALGTYTQTTGTYALETCGANAGPTGDDATMAATAIGFSFNYFGVNYTQFTISTNGNVQLGDGSGTANNPAYSTAWTDVAMPNAAVPNNIIALCWDDWNASAGNITYGVTGVAPNRKLVVCFNVTGRGDGSVGELINGQVVLEETTNIVRLITTQHNLTAIASTQGIENATGSVGYPVAGRNNVAWGATNDMQVFTPNVIAVSSYSWSPATFLNNTAINNPNAIAMTASTTYTVTATASNGCSLSATTSVTVGAALVSTPTATPATICSGQSTSLDAGVVGGGAPYTYDWSDGVSSIGTTSPLTVFPSGTTTFTVTVTDNCLSTTSATVTVTVNPSPSVSVSPTSGAYCGTAIPVTASGTADTYAWSPAAGLNATTGTSVNASPAATTVYTVTGTTTANGCTTTATTTITKGIQIQTVTPTATPSTVCANGTSNLNVTATAALPFVRITEVTLYDQGTGLTSPYPGFITSTGALDFAEITNTSIVAADISGWTYADYSSASTTANHSYTFGPGTIIPSNSVLVLHLGAGTDIPASRYYNTGGTSNFYSSGGLACFVLKNGATVVDAVATNGATFAAGTGVTGADWSGSASALSGNAGSSRTATTDSNTGADWTTASSHTQTIGYFDAGYINPNNGTITGYAWSPSTFLNNTAIQTPTASLMTATTTYTVTVTEALGCTASGTVTVNVGDPLLVTAAATPGSICAGSSTSLSASPSGGGAPYTYDWSDGVGSIGTTNPLSILPSASGTYTVTVTDACLSTVSATVSVTVNPVPSVSVSNSAPNLCSPITSSNLTASGTADTYAWSPATGLNVTTGTAVIATPTVTTVYTVTGTTTATGCTSTATTTVTKGVDFVTATATATPATVCVGGSSNLLASGTLPLCSNYYSVATTTYGLLPTAGFASGPSGDDANLLVTMPFSFNFYGTSSNQIDIVTNGYVILGGATASAYTAQTIPDVTAPNGVVALSWCDLSAGAGQITYGTVGTSPNQIFVVDYNAVPALNGSGTISGQIHLYEGSNRIEIHVTAVSATNLKTFGVENTTGTDATSVTGLNNAAWTTAVPAAAAFTQCFSATITGYSWSPSANLDNPAIANPVASPMLANTVYTVTMTNSTGCTATATASVTVDPLVVAASASPSPACDGSSASLVATVTGGGAPYTYDWSDGVGSIGTTNPLSIVAMTGTTVYTVTVSDFCGATQTSTVSLTVNAPPTLSVTNSNPSLCAPIVSSTLGVSGADTYVWSPATGLNVTTGASVVSTPSVTTVYTVTGTSTATGCTTTATTTVTVGVSFLSAAATASPDAVCAPGTTQLNATATLPSCSTYYSIASATYGLQPTTGFTALLGGDDDDLITGLALPFSLNFFGTVQSSINIGTNGYIYFGTPNGGSILSAGVLNGINIFAADMLPTAGQISYGTVGVSPNQIFVVDYNAMPEFSGGGTHSGQIQIFENGRIEIHITSATSTRVKTMGLRNAAGTDNAIPTGFNSLGWTVSTPVAYAFTQCFTATLTGYSWSPAADLSNPAIANPVASNILGTTTYTVTMTNSTGCTTSATVTVTVAPLAVSAAASAATVCAGNPSTLTATVTGGGAPYTYDWSDGVGSIGTTNPLTVNPTSSATYTVTVTDACLNVSTATVAVSVLPSPSVGLTSSAAGICTPGPVTLTASGATTYSWNGILDPTILTQTITFNVAAQPTEVNFGPGNIVASATMAALPAGAVVTSSTLTYNGINALGASFGSDVNLGFSGAVTAAATGGIGAPSAAGVFNYVQTYVGGVNTAGGTVDLLYWDVADDNTGTDEATFPLGATAATLVISYQIPASGTTLVVTPSVTTTYTVTGTNGSGCTNTATVTVVIPPGSTTTATATPAFICAGGTSQLNAVATYPPPTAPTYCAVTNQGSSCVTNVTLNTLNSTPPACVSPFYHFNTPTGSETTTLTPGSSYPLTVTTGGTAIVSVFIDYDRNGVYDASEWVQPYTSATTGTVTINVPPGASIGQTGMRVRSRLNGNQNDATTACLVGMGSGSTEDYVVTIGTPVSGSFTYSWSPAAGLNNPAIQNPIATVAATSTYTVTASDIYGCTSTATVTVNVDPLVVSASASVTTICQGISSTLTGVATGGGQPYTYDWSDGTISVGTTAALTVSPTTTTTYTFTVTDNCATVLSATPITITVNPAPGASVTPSTGLYCAPTPVALAASSGDPSATFAWSPAAGLNVTTGANVNATPSVASTYTVTATGTNGCTSTATASITVGTPIAVNATADTTEGCSPFNTVLHACANPVFNTYNVASIPFAAHATPGSGVTTLAANNAAVTTMTSGTLDDGGWAALPIGFSFNFYGVSYSQFAVSTNGFVYMGGTPSTYTGYGNTFPSTAAANPCIAACYGDLDWRTAGAASKIEYWMEGSAPSRKLVVNFVNGQFYLGVAGSIITTQVILSETSNKVEIHTTNVTNSTATNVRVQGMQNAGATASAVVTGRNGGTWEVAAGDAFELTPAAVTCNNTGITFAWTPSGNLDNGAIADPTVTGLTAVTLYTLTATNASGCSAQDTITLIVHDQAPTPTITPSGPLSFCPGGSVNLTSSNNTYPNNWSTSETTQTITVSTTQLVTLIASDAYCPSAPVSVNVLRHDTIQPLINVAGGGATICTGTRDLTADGAPQYTSWLWSTTETTQMITISAPGTYSVVATDLNGCLTHNEQTFTAGVAPPAPVITASTALTVCNGTIITMTSNIDPVIGSLSWSPTSQTTASITNTFSPPGVYDFFVTYDSLGCTSESNHLVVTVNPTPDVFTFLPADSACIGDVITLSGSGLLNVTAISFNGTPATTFTIVDDFTITVTVPAGATTGSLSLTDGSTGCVGVSPVFTIKVICASTLTLKAYLQGYYDASTSTMRPAWTNQFRSDLGNGNMGTPTGTEADLVMVELYDASNTFAYSDSMMLDINGDGSVSFPSAVNGNSYYILVKHRCHIQTRSAGLVLMGTSTSYDFTTASTQVDELGGYGGPMMVEVEPGVWAFFAGDQTQDGFVGGDDVSNVDNDNLAGLLFEYLNTDINGDGFVGGDDVSITDNNNLLGVFYLYP
ncbi:MAG: lamin tail domain-containing protein [Bacteroidetes bacterium]|nr:lamin tail domain-containing protein [Bacteroidota bacterium]